MGDAKARRRQSANPSPPPAPAAPPPGAAPVDPDQLMAEINRPRLGRMVTIAVIIHVLVIGLASVGYIGRCIQYRSLHPKWVIKQQQKEQAEKQGAVDAAKAIEEARKRQTAAREQATKTAEPGTEGSSASGTAATPPTTGAAAPPAVGTTAPPLPVTGTESKGKSPVEQKLEETSQERPKVSPTTMDEVNDLE